ncbi:MAG: inositol monophosphatase family protein [Thermodesulfovibrionales bacterium]
MTAGPERSFLAVAVEAARLAGEVVMRNLGGLSRGDIEAKHAADFVTRADRESEEAIKGAIARRFPDHSFLAEESGAGPSGSEYRWIIDPLDGTTNFIHGFPVFAVSVALEHRGEIIAGAVLDPTRQELFTAEKGGGAFLNGRPVRVSGLASMADSLIATGFPFRKKELIDVYLRAFKGVFMKVSGMRRAGAAALDLAYVAAGRCEGFFEAGLSPWDVAAGDILVREAGGLISDFAGGGGHLSTGNVVAANPAVHAVLLREVREAFGGAIER